MVIIKSGAGGLGAVLHIAVCVEGHLRFQAVQEAAKVWVVRCGAVSAKLFSIQFDDDDVYYPRGGRPREDE